MPGHITQEGKGIWRIVVEAGRDPATGKRKRIVRRYRGRKAEYEIEANKFAAELLIDEAEICKDWTTAEISAALNVPKQLVEYKFTNSGLY